MCSVTYVPTCYSFDRYMCTNNNTEASFHASTRRSCDDLFRNVARSNCTINIRSIASQSNLEFLIVDVMKLSIFYFIPW
ncbi:unnamed protein product [Triticum turgidum subsp. durum]|uniref:Uncharacterized protein n=1 Tax=Triticum turgidum subsp. durum TaxID=4567 RepID=A0A9R1NYY1_TRITD|nr:unnamed protein product [Triticum turgidum subsp. durum]